MKPENHNYRTYKPHPRPDKTRTRRRRRRGFSDSRALVGGVGIFIVVIGLAVFVYQAFGFFGSTPVPADNTMSLTVPKMERVEGVPVYTGPANDEDKLGAGTVHLDSTGYPWESGSNVYIAGHRLGYPNTESFLVFYDLNKLENGDEVVLRDSIGTKYVYRVFNRIVADPDDIQLAEPVPGRSVVSLQTCTLPDYAKRLVVQAEYVTSKAA